MFEKIIHFSVEQKFIVFLLVLTIIIGGAYSLSKLPIDAVPDITNNQVQVVTTSPSLAPQEVEQLITFPIENSLANIPQIQEIRSISRYGLSVVTVVFKESMDQLDARQFVNEQLSLAAEEIPTGLGSPELMPITTGLGEIYQYTLTVSPEYRNQYDPMDLRTIQDWIVKRQMNGIPGIIEISSFGGYLKQYEVAIDPLVLRSFDLSLTDIFNALEENNQNSGGSYIEKGTSAFYIRSEGRIERLEDIGSIVVAENDDSPIRIKDIAEVQFGSPQRYGAMTMDGNGEAVGGIALMLKGANSSEAIKNVQERVERIQNSLPPGVQITPYLDRSDLVGRAINTVQKNLIEGGLIVILVLLLLLGNWRAGLIVASVIPLSMLFAFIMMHLFGISANLMSLGAIDFGIVVDGAVIIVENALHVLFISHLGKKLSQKEMNEVIKNSSSSIYQSAAFGVLIILVVFLPIITLTGIEGKMFKPMALTVSFALLGAMILSLTYVPMISSLVLKKHIEDKQNISSRLIKGIKSIYLPLLSKSLHIPKMLIALITALFIASIFLLKSLGGEFIPTLEEGDLAMQMTIPPGSSLTQSIKTSTQAESILLERFPEVKHVVSKIGTSEVPTDPMAIEDADIMIILKDKSEWVTTNNREALVDAMKSSLDQIKGASFEFTQPIQLRFNELMTGAKTDIAIKIFGENIETLALLGSEVADIVKEIPGAADVKVEQTDGLAQLVVKINREQLAQYQVTVDQVNEAVRTAFAGSAAGVVFENERKFDLVVRYQAAALSQLDLNELFVTNYRGQLVPLSAIATLESAEGPMLITRENAQRRINIGVNIRNRDISSLVEEIKTTLNQKLNLPSGYYITYGGQFENLEAAQARLAIAVPSALLLILVLLYFAFRSIRYALLIFSVVPMSAIGGVLALWVRDMPFSISAGIGFIALFGVAVLNGIVLISYYNQLQREDQYSLKDIIVIGSGARLRPVLMTAAVAAFGFLPMALSTSAGAEVQKPLATVVIGGLISSTFLTLFILPNLYAMMNRHLRKATVLVLLLLAFQTSQGQYARPQLSLDSALSYAAQNHASYKNLELIFEQATNNEKGAFKLGNTSIEYTQGQINDDFNDWILQIDQNLGNLFLLKANKSYSKAQSTFVSADNDLKKEQLDLKVKSLWVNWYYASQRTAILNEWTGELKRIEQGLDRAFAAGELSFKDHLTIENVIIKLNKEETLSLLQKQELFKELKVWCGADIPPEPGNLLLDYGKTSGESEIASKFIDLNQLEREMIEQEWKKTKSERAPEFNVGYFNQQILGATGLDGFRAGISLPLFSKTEKMAARNVQLKLAQRENDQWLSLQQFNEQLALLIEQQIILNSTMEVLPTLQKINEDWATILTLKNSGEITVFEWAQLTSEHITKLNEVLAIQNRLIINAFQIEFLTR